jgi:hypothetical protein
MAININQLTSELRMMPDQALQRMAQMYKQDPYIFPMVIAEDMARKKMRQAAQAQMAQGPQPKVADQALMSMGQQPQAAPGIAALQAPNMQNMADGGIAGYADGGDFAQHSEPVVRMSGGGAVQRYQDEGLVQSTYGEQMAKLFGLPLRAFKSLVSAPDVVREREAEQEKARAATSAIGPSDTDMTRAVLEAQSGMGEREEWKPKKREKEKEKESKAAGKPVAPVAAAPVAPATATAEAIPTYTAPTAEATASGIATLSKAPDEATKKAYDELRALYEPERKELEQRRGQRGGEALLRAGLAMLSGTSPYAAVNIGKGATEGLNAYQEAQRYDDQAARALRQADISMRLAQRQEEAGNRKDAISLFSQAEHQKQVAVNSAQQAQQIKDTREYRQGSLDIMRQNAATNAKKVQAYINALEAPQKDKQRMMAEYGKIQTKVMEALKTDANFLTLSPEKQSAYRQKRLQEEIANNPFLSGLLFQSAPGKGPVLDLTGGKDDEED